MIKANKIGSLYMNIRTPAQNSILAITIHYSDTKISADKNKAGNGGVVTYEIKDSKTAKVTFTGVTCTKSKCDKDISYYWLSSTSMQEVYTQTVCPYSYFSMLDIKSDHPITMTKITSSPSF